MKVQKLGDGEPEHSIMYCIHGDEPCGKLAVERILQEDLNYKKPVKLVFANEKAYKSNQKWIDEDLNRAFGSSNSSYESKLAKKIKSTVTGTKVLDLHSSYSHPEAFGITTRDSRKLERNLQEIGLDKVADMSSVYSHQIEGCDRIAVECGYTRSEKAIRNAYRITKRFLKKNNVIEGDVFRKDAEIFEVHEKVEGSGYQFLKQNFKPVEPGETFALNGSNSLEADEKFYPVLMSTTGYQDMVGFKAKKK